MKPGGLMEAIIELSHERGLDQESIIEAIEDAIVGAAYRKYKNYKNIEAELNPQTGNIDLMHYKVVVDHVVDHDNEILLEEVIKLDPQAECGDEVEYEIDAKEFKSVIAQTARQLIFQKIREAERESVVEKYAEKKGEIIHGTVSRVERGRVIINIGNTVEAALDYREQIPFEKLQTGEHVRILLIGLSSEGRGPQLLVSRSHPDFLVKLFEVEVPEVFDGIIEVVAAAREPGRRAKVAVYTNDPDIDPIGACVGMRGSRVQAIVSELCGERIDIIEWADNPEQFIANALAPAEILQIDLDKERRTANVRIAQDQLSLAIGKGGQNVRLASKLTGTMINIDPWEKEEQVETSPIPPLPGEVTQRERNTDEVATDSVTVDRIESAVEAEATESQVAGSADISSNIPNDTEPTSVTLSPGTVTEMPAEPQENSGSISSDPIETAPMRTAVETPAPMEVEVDGGDSADVTAAGPVIDPMPLSAADKAAAQTVESDLTTGQPPEEPLSPLTVDTTEVSTDATDAPEVSTERET
jgi:transcription termination/antitermination protein NusA